MQVDGKNYSNLESVVAYMFYKMIVGAKRRDRKWYDAVQSTYVDSFGFVGCSYKFFGSVIRMTNFRNRDFFFRLKNRRKFTKKRYFWK